MSGSNLKDLMAFLVVAEEGSFTRAAARLGMSQSSISLVIRGLEARLGLRLFARTTRSVSLTPAGERLLELIGFTGVVRDGEVVTGATPDATPGYILTRFGDKYGRPVAFAFAGDTDRPDLEPVFTDSALLKTSVNHRLLADGLVYPTFYSKLYPDLRATLTEAAQAAVLMSYQGEEIVSRWGTGTQPTVLVSEIWHVSGGQTVTQTLQADASSSGQPYRSADNDAQTPEGVLGVTARAKTVSEAQKLAYQAVDAIDWPDGFCRRDIGWRAIAREKKA